MKSLMLNASIGVFLVTAFAAHAQSDGPYDLKWSTIDGGGGTSSGGAYSLSGTIGQPDAGEMRGGNFSLHGGFWSAFAVVQSPGAPLLRIRLVGTSGAVISWPAPSTGWVLQETSVLASEPELTIWANVSLSPTVIGSENTVTFSPVTGIRYFRLRHP